MIEKEQKIDFLKTNLDISVINNYIPQDIVNDYISKNPQKFRQRLYTLDVTLKAMIYQCLSEDKSEQKAVLFLHSYFKNLQEKIKESEEAAKKNYYNELVENEKRKPGRPRKNFVKVQKSKMKEISYNTASFDEARQRFPLELLKEIFKNIRPDIQEKYLWHGHEVFIVDGTTAKTVDNKELREHFMGNSENSKLQPLPLLKIEGMINLYGGNVEDIEISSYSDSESNMFKKLYRSISENTIVLCDDLYSSYGHFSYARSKNVYLISQGKHKRNDTVIKELSSGDELVELKSNQRPTWFDAEDILPDTMILRRISFKDPKEPKKNSYIYTNLLDAHKYPGKDILALYFCRWDIELSFKEIKTVLNMEYLRGKSVEMVYKELFIYFSVYNILKLLIIKTMHDNKCDFFSQRETVQIGITRSKSQNIYVDKLGRSYAKKSPGRYKGINNKNK